MNLESAVKYHFAKSTSISDSPRATSTDLLTGTDVMTAIGYCQSKESFGFSAFSGKMEISQNDKVKAVQLLTQYALKHCDKVAALRKLEGKVKAKVMQILAKFAYEDYCRSAASVTECVKCSGRGVISKRKMVVKHEGVKDKSGSIVFRKEKLELVGELCTKCNGKGVISCACNDCKGRGDVIDREELERTGMPVRKACKRCSGRGYERIPASKAYHAVSAISGLSPDQWKKSVSRFYESLSNECEISESKADYILKKVTK
ncbi:antitermination protein [Providencia huaxiensis]|uniref:antitermination protein Q n=1 Tax=Providencia huaxiensis TaxID=2027290 RepID=UPI0024AC79C6|nr:antitermination protein [Providencia rettgeri]